MNQVRAGAVLNYVIVVLNILTGLLYTPYMLRCLGQNEYGLYSLVASVIAYLTLLDFGFGSSIVRYAAKIKATGSKEDEWRLYGMFLCGYAIIGILVTMAGVVLYNNIDQMFDQTMTSDELWQARVMMILMVGNLAVTFPFSLFGSIISAYERFVFQRIVNITRILLSTAVLVGVLYLGYKAIALVIVQTVFSLGTLLANFLYCRYKLKIRLCFRNFNMRLLREIMVFSWWNFLGAIVDRIYWSTGQFILGVYSGPVAVAVFSVAITLMNLYMSMSTSVSSVLLPRMTVMATRNDSDKDISELFIRTGRLQFCLMGLILSGFVVFGEAFIGLWAGPGYSGSFVITLMFFAVLLCPLIQNVGLTIMVARGQIKFRSVSYLCISLLSFPLQILLAKQYGALGCAWGVTGALFLGQWVVMNIYYYKCQRLDIPMFWRQILTMSIGPACVTLLGYLVCRHLVIGSWYLLGGLILLYSLIYTLVLFKFSMHSYERSIVSSLLSRVGIMVKID